jgi:hypothetical protein
MEIKLLLLKAIGASYYSSHAERPDADPIQQLHEKVMEHLKLPEDPLETSREKSGLVKLRNVLMWMHFKGHNAKLDLEDLLSRIRVACGDNDRMYDLFPRSLLPVTDPAEAGAKLDELMADLYEFVAVEQFVAMMRSVSRTLGFDREKIKDIKTYRDELMTKLQELPLGGKKRAAHVARIIDISDMQSVEDVYHMAQTAIDPRAILRYGFKAMNRMTGDQGGARRGEWSNVSALPGQNKSGNLLDTFISMCLFNTPVLFDETKKPLHVYTTIEDKLELVFQKLYVILMQEEHGLPVKIRGLKPSEMAEYVKKRLEANGWNVRFVEFPNGGDSEIYLDILKGFEQEGFEIVSAGCDYVNLIGKQGIPAMTAGDEVQGLHRKLRGFTSPHNIFHYTAHQLSTDAKTLARQFPDDYVRKLPGKGYYEGCKKLDTEFDYEYIVAKTVSGGATWQEFQWSKHRKMGATDESAKYFCLKFLELPMIGFKYDVDLDIDTSYRKVGARTAGPDAGAEWSDFE